MKNLVRELYNRVWFRRSCPAVKKEMERLAQSHPMHIQSDIDALDKSEDLFCIAEVACLVDNETELFYYALAVKQKRRDKNGKDCDTICVKRWMCS